MTPDASIYVAPRDVAGEFKASLHGTGDWRIGFTSQSVVQRTLRPTADRIVGRFAPTPENQPGVSHAFSVWIPWLSVVRPAHGRRETAPVIWLSSPREGCVTEVAMTLIAPTVVVSRAVDHRGEPVAVLGTIPRPTGDTLWVVAATRECPPSEAEEYRRLQSKHADELRAQATAESDFRSLFIGVYPDGSYYFLDLAIPTTS